MTLLSKFAGTCTACGQRFPAGTAIDWTRGLGAKHADPNVCAAALCAAAAPPAAAPGPPTIVNSAAIVAFLNGAQARGLRAPKARFLAPSGEMTLYTAGRTSRYPGAIQIKIAGNWIGRIMPDGSTAGPLANDPALLDLLATIAADPAAAAKAFGALAGRCSFCNLPLTDEGSIEYGYGAKCARNYGLPHRHKGTKVLGGVAA